ncbi:MAG TPA: DUF2339 domain-containing protein [Pseudonocardia sp.]
MPATPSDPPRSDPRSDPRNDPRADPRADAERVTRLAAELAELGRRLAWARHDLLTLSVAAPAPAQGGPAQAGPTQAGPAQAAPTHPATAVEPDRPAEGAVEPDRRAAPRAGSAPATGPAAQRAAGPAPQWTGDAGSPPARAGRNRPGSDLPPPPVGPPARWLPAGLPGWDSGNLLPWIGAAVTLVGVAMLLALAASRGWFGVPARLVAGAVLGAGLVGLAGRLHRRAEGRAGALALAGTGFAALYLDIGTATARYGYLSQPVGLLLGLLVAGAALALADRWRSQLLACGAVVGIGLLIPGLTDGHLPLLVALVLVPQLAAVPLVARRGWACLAVLASVFPVLYGLLVVFEVLLSGSADRGQATVAVLAVFLVGATLAVLGARRLPAAVSAGRLAAAPLPALGLAQDWVGWRGALLAGSVGVVLVAVAVLGSLALTLDAVEGGKGARGSTGGTDGAAVSGGTGGSGAAAGSGPSGGAWAARLRLPDPVVAAAGVLGGSALLEATVLLTHGAALTGVLLGEALALMLVAVVTGRRGPLLAGAVYGLAGLGTAVYRDAPLRALTRFPEQPYLVLGQPVAGALLTGLVLSALVLALAAASLVALDRTGLTSGDGMMSRLAWLPIGAVGLYGAAGVVITVALLAVPSQAGFVGGHAVVTISWTLVALVLLARGVTSVLPRIVGLVLIAAALGKLVLFDLVTLDGLARVAAFLGAGLLILAAGSRYARLVARSRS